MERIKQGYHYLLPNICEEVMAKTSSDDEYATVGSSCPPSAMCYVRESLLRLASLS